MEERRNNLVYYTVGFNPKYLDLLYISIQSLRVHNDIDILVICDEAMINQCKNKLSHFKDIEISPCKDSISAMDAAMKKVLIFQYDISKYSKIMYIDSDILVDLQLEPIFSQIVDDTKLYAFAENKETGYHANHHFSLLKYTNKDYEFFYRNKIYVFNTGLFVFQNTKLMNDHFSNVLDMISNHTGDYYYEQSFMNVYFNTRNLVDTNVLNEKNCIMNLKIDDTMMSKIPRFPWSNVSCRHKFFHFSWSEGFDAKFNGMMLWKNKYFK